MSIELSGIINNFNHLEYEKLLQNSELKIVNILLVTNRNENKIIELTFGNKNLEQIYFIGLCLNNYALNISNALSHNTNLKILDISENTLDFYFFCKIMKAIRLNNTLEELNVNNYCFGDSYNGAKEIADMLLVNTTLRKLCIRHNKLNDDGFLKIIKALETNFTLMELDITYPNSITKNIIPELMKMLEINNVITIHGIDHLLPEDFFHSRKNSRKIKSANY